MSCLSITILRTLPWLLLLLAAAARGEVTVEDGAGRQVRLAAPARRIVSLAPHVTELLYAAGAGERLVGAVEYSDYPAAARALPRVGGYAQPDLEGIVALRPDLVVGWASGNPPAQTARLEALGLTLYYSEPRRLDAIPAELERLGRLAGSEAAADAAAAAFRARLDALRGRYAGRLPVPLFYQIWDRPLLTVGGVHIISDLIGLCGGVNVFGALAGLTPQLDREAVLAADPEAIIASGMGEARPEWLDEWRQWPQLLAVKRGNLFFIHPDLIQRHTPRLLDGAERLCGELEEARGRRRGEGR